MIKKILLSLATLSILIVATPASSVYAARCENETLALKEQVNGNLQPLSGSPRTDKNFIIEAANLSLGSPNGIPGSTWDYFITITTPNGDTKKSANIDLKPIWQFIINSGELSPGVYETTLKRRGSLLKYLNGQDSICKALGFEVTTPSGASLQHIDTVATGLGTASADLGTLANQIYKLAIGIAGVLAILRIIIGGLRVATSAGDPKALDEGRETITSSLIGLAFILLAALILSIIGVDILGIPNFDSSGGGVTIKP